MAKNVLKDLRVATKLSQRGLATLAGLHKSTVSKFEVGDRNISDDVTDKIAKVIAERLSIAYVAGLFDRNSNWDVTKVLMPHCTYPNYTARIRFTTKHFMLANVLARVFGAGFVHKHTQGNYSIWTFFAAGQKAKKVAEMLLPYLVLKRREAEIVIKAATIAGQHRGQPRIMGQRHKPVGLGDLRVFKSVKLAAKALGCTREAVSEAANGKTKGRLTTDNMTGKKIEVFFLKQEVAEALFPKEYALICNDMSYQNDLERLHLEIRSFKTHRGKLIK